MKTIAIDDNTYAKLTALALHWKQPSPDAYIAGRIRGLHRDVFGPLEVEIEVEARLTTDEVDAVTCALSKYHAGLLYPPRMWCVTWCAEMPMVDMDDDAADGHAAVIARAIWSVLGRFVSVTVRGKGTCDCKCGECESHEGWKVIHFGQKEFERRDIGIPDTRSRERRVEDEALFAMFMQEGT